MRIQSTQAAVKAPGLDATASTGAAQRDAAKTEPLRPGDILLFHNAAGPARLISWFTRSPFYHVALYDHDTYVIEARPRGVVRRDLRSNIGGDDFVVIPAPQAKGQNALTWATQQIGDDYDVLGVAAIVIDQLFFYLHLNFTTRRNRFTCGGLVVLAFQDSGVDLFPECSPAEIVPADFARFLSGHE